MEQSVVFLSDAVLVWFSPVVGFACSASAGSEVVLADFTLRRGESSSHAGSPNRGTAVSAMLSRPASKLNQASSWSSWVEADRVGLRAS